MTELWKDVPGYEEMYQISNLGRVKSLKRKVKARYGLRTVNERILKIKPNKRLGYHQIDLWKNDKGKTFRLHRLVMLTFKPISNPKEMTVNHIDGDKTNNRLDNLEWCTQQENDIHKVTVLKKIVKKVDQYDLNDNWLATYSSLKFASDLLGVNHTGISMACSGKRKTAYGYKWRYSSDT